MALRWICNSNVCFVSRDIHSFGVCHAQACMAHSSLIQLKLKSNILSKTQTSTRMCYFVYLHYGWTYLYVCFLINGLETVQFASERLPQTNRSKKTVTFQLCLNYTCTWLLRNQIGNYLRFDMFLFLIHRYIWGIMF